MRIEYVLAFILLASLAPAAVAQQPSPTPAASVPSTVPQRPDEADVVRITTNLVQVDAVVTDRSGRQITDLKPDELQIFEDGKRQKITHFAYVYSGSPESAPPSTARVVDKNAPPSPPVKLKPDQIKRTIALVVDDLGLSFQSTYYVRHALKKFVDEEMQPGDLVAIVRTAGGMGALQSFTSDKRQLYAAIERIKWYMSGRSGVGAFPPIGSDRGPGRDDEETNTGPPPEDLDQFREDLFSVGTLGALNYVVRGLRELPGRKSILLLSDGFKIFNRDDPGRSTRVLEALRRLTDLANRASVVIYTMDARGLQTISLNAEDDVSGMSAEDVETQLSNRRNDLFDSQDGLNYLAQETGGIAIRNNNDLSRGIKRVMEDQSGYYLIGYRPDESTFDAKTGRRKFHHLSLKVVRAGRFTARMRNGFYGISDEEAKPIQRTAQQQIVSALVSPFGATGVHLQLTSLFANSTEGSIMRSLLHIDARDLTFATEPDGWHKATVNILAVTFGDNGLPIDQAGPSYSIRLPDREYQRVLRDGLVYTVTVPIKKPGAYQLRVALRDAPSERVGSATQFVEIPDLKKNRLALSGMVVVGMDQATYEKLRSANVRTESSKPDTVSTQPVTNPPAAMANTEGVSEGDARASAAVREFRAKTVMRFGFWIYNARLDKVTARPQLTIQIVMFRDGQPIFTGHISPYDIQNPADPKRLQAGGVIQLGSDMTPGEYVLQVVVTDALADEKHRTATQWMDFEIVN